MLKREIDITSKDFSFNNVTSIVVHKYESLTLRRKTSALKLNDQAPITAFYGVPVAHNALFGILTQYLWSTGLRLEGESSDS